MKYWSEYDVTRAIESAIVKKHEYRLAGTMVMVRLMNWTNANSDGWSHWRKPVKAAQSLMTLLDDYDEWEPVEDVTLADLATACRPIKAFLTKQGVEHDVVFRGVAPTDGKHWRGA